MAAGAAWLRTWRRLATALALGCCLAQATERLLAKDHDFEVTAFVPKELRPWFSRSAQVFGVHVFASAAADDWALQHVARSLAKYLDQDEDGVPDDPAVVRHLVEHRGAMLLTRSAREYEEGIAALGDRLGSSPAHGVIKNDRPAWNCSVTDAWVYAEIFQEECAPAATEAYGQVPPGVPYGREDASWEEVFHLITHVGYGCAYPEVWGFRADAANPLGYPGAGVPESQASRALDAMLGDCGAAYNQTQTPKHDGICNYHYADESCFYPCLVNEYVHTMHLAQLGALDHRCGGDQQQEYSFCTQRLAAIHDPAGYALGASSMLPQQLPDGHYRPRRAAHGKAERGRHLSEQEAHQQGPGRSTSASGSESESQAGMLV